MRQFLLFLFLLCSSQSYAQRSAKDIEKPDPEAKKTLLALKKKFDKMGSLSADYTLIIENGKDKETQQGSIARKGEKFRLKNTGNELICDGESVWFYQKTGSTANTVQISSYEPEDQEDEFLSPSSIFKLHEQEDKFFYAITNEVGTLQEIEFKPRERNSEYLKMRLKVDTRKLEIKEVKVFSRDGMRYTLVLNKLAAANFPDSHFRFDKSKYPGVKISDLRD